MRRRSRVAPLVVVVLALAAALTLSACGDDDDDTCGYLFVDVPNSLACENIALELDCATFTFAGDPDFECSVGGCLVCQDFDTDFDGDFDFDGDVDDDD
jgi:hypothetical protein